MKYSRKNKKIRRNKKIKYKNTRKIKYIHTSGYGSLQKGGEIITTEDEYYKVLEASDPKLYGLTYNIEKEPNFGYNAVFSNSLNDYLRRLLDTIISYNCDNKSDIMCMQIGAKLAKYFETFKDEKFTLVGDKMIINPYNSYEEGQTTTFSKIITDTINNFPYKSITYTEYWLTDLIKIKNLEKYDKTTYDKRMNSDSEDDKSFALYVKRVMGDKTLHDLMEIEEVINNVNNSHTEITQEVASNILVQIVNGNMIKIVRRILQFIASELNTMIININGESWTNTETSNYARDSVQSIDMVNKIYQHIILSITSLQKPTINILSILMNIMLSNDVIGKMLTNYTMSIETMELNMLNVYSNTSKNLIENDIFMPKINALFDPAMGHDFSFYFNNKSSMGVKYSTQNYYVINIKDDDISVSVVSLLYYINGNSDITFAIIMTNSVANILENTFNINVQFRWTIFPDRLLPNGKEYEFINKIEKLERSTITNSTDSETAPLLAAVPTSEQSSNDAGEKGHALTPTKMAGVLGVAGTTAFVIASGLGKIAGISAFLGGGRKTRKYKKSKHGGKVTGSGGFGCIFNPALKCSGQQTRKQRNAKTTQMITKLMKKKYAKKEYYDIVAFQKQLKDIPNYTDYFLLDGFSICNPGKLNASDLEDFDKKCTALKKINISTKNVNKSLNKLTALNMPYGGIDIGDYIVKTELNHVKMIQLNNSLINLLTKGIEPMNKKHIYHVDIKESNVLVDDVSIGQLNHANHTNHFYTRLIDWGLSATYDGEKAIPKTLQNRPFQYNVPFSVILFTPLFTQMYSEFLKSNPDPSYIALRTFVINYVVAWIDKRGPGHLKNINGIFKKFFEKELRNIDNSYKNDVIVFDYTFYFIFEYLTQILFKYTKNNKMDLMDYFSNVFLKNIDIWGFTMIYVPIMEYLHNNYSKLNEHEILIIQHIKKCSRLY